MTVCREPVGVPTQGKAVSGKDHKEKVATTEITTAAEMNSENSEGEDTNEGKTVR